MLTEFSLRANEAEANPSKSHNRYIDVKEYGAKGDGIADDTEFIQNAIDELSESGGVLYFPGGNYRITKRLLVGGSHPRPNKVINYIEIAGAGKNASRLLGDGVDYIIGAKTVLNEKTGKRTITHGFSIRDVTLAPFLNANSDNGCGGIDASYMIRWSVRNCHFVGLKTGIYSVQRAEMPADVPDALAVYIIRIHDNLFYGCGDYAIKLGRIFDLSIENNEIEHGSGGIKIGETGDGFDAAANNIRIVNNVIEGLGWNRPAISGSCWIGSRIVGNYFEANEGGDIELIAGEKDGWIRSVTIASNTFQPNKRQREGSYGPIKLSKAFDTILTANFTTGANLLHPESSSLGRGVNLISNTLNNPAEIGDIAGARSGDPEDYAGTISQFTQQAEQWTVSGPVGSVGIHSMFGVRFQPKGQEPRSLQYGSSAPTDNVMRRQAGEIIFNLKPSLSKDNKILLGWVCTESGAPGVWRAFSAEAQ